MMQLGCDGGKFALSRNGFTEAKTKSWEQYLWDLGSSMWVEAISPTMALTAGPIELTLNYLNPDIALFSPLVRGSSKTCQSDRPSCNPLSKS